MEILSGGESEGGSAEETVCQETQTTRAVSNSHADVEKSVVRCIFHPYFIYAELSIITLSYWLLSFKHVLSEKERWMAKGQEKTKDIPRQQCT